MILKYEISSIDKNKSIKDILKREFGISNRLMTKLKLNKKILINDNIAMVNNVPCEGDIITIYIDFEEEDNTVPQKGDLEILYEDEYYVAVNKPSNIVVHPCSFHLDNTLANYIKYYLKNNKKVRPVNRLDNGTSGVVLFAKNEYVQELFKNLKEQPIKEYIAIVYEHFNDKKGTIELPIARRPNSIIEREVNIEAGQTAITHYEVLNETFYDDIPISIVKVLLETGRTHQIRVHMTYTGHPLLGDTLYTNELIKMKYGEKIEEIGETFSSQALHAYKLEFKHPITKKNIQIIAELPKNIKMLYKGLT